MPYGPVVHLALLFAAMLPAHSANAQYLIPKPLDPPTSTIIVSILSPQSLPSNSSSSLSTPMPTVPVVGILDSPLSGIPNPSPSSLIPTPSSPIQTQFPSGSTGFGLSYGGVIGGAVGVCFLAVCLGLVVFWYIERWRRCVLVLFANRFRGVCFFPCPSSAVLILTWKFNRTPPAATSVRPQATVLAAHLETRIITRTAFSPTKVAREVEAWRRYMSTHTLRSMVSTFSE